MKTLGILLAILFAVSGLAAEDEAKPERVLVLDFGHDPEHATSARLINDLVATAAESASKFEIITGADIKRVLEFEAEKQSFGDCEEESCLAEIAGAMGADLIVFGQVGSLGELVVVTLNLFDAKASKSRGRRTVQVRDQAQLPPLIERAIGELLGAEAPAASGPSPLGLGLVAGGVVVIAGGYGLAAMANEGLRDPAATDKGTTSVLGNISLFGGLGIGIATTTVGALVLAGVLGGE